MSPAPSDNEPLLRHAAHYWATRAKDPKAPPELSGLTLALVQARTLVAGDDDGPRPIAGLERPMLVTFSDDEAAQAWAAQAWAASRPPAQGAPALGFVDVGGADLEGGRERWLRWLRGVGADTVIVNPAGPNFCLTTVRWLQRVKPPRLRGRGDPTDGDPWLELDARAAQRQRVPPLLREVAEAIDGEQPVSRQAILRELNDPTINALRSGLWMADLELLRARLEIRLGRTSQASVRLSRAAAAYAVVGELGRSQEIDAMLAALRG